MYETCLRVSEITNAKEAYYSYREADNKKDVFLPVELRVC